MKLSQRVLAVALSALASGVYAVPPDPAANPHSFITVWSPTPGYAA